MQYRWAGGVMIFLEQCYQFNPAYSAERDHGSQVQCYRGVPVYLRNICISYSYKKYRELSNILFNFCYQFRLVNLTACWEETKMADNSNYLSKLFIERSTP